jgi:hypothetical protein
VVVEARDALGITVVERKPLTILEGGVPRVTIMTSALSPTILSLGETLSITATVKNIGTTPVRTQGPPPGTLYTLTQTYNSLSLPQSSGAFRLGATCDALPVDLEYPYRWGLGDPVQMEKRTVDGRTLFCPSGAPNDQCPLEERTFNEKAYIYLLPGQTVQVTGQVRFTERPLRRNPLCYLALIQEDVRKHEESVNPTRVTVEY